MIELIINCTDNMGKIAAHIFDIFFSIMGIHYVEKSEENINIFTHSLIINYGSVIPSQKLKDYLDLGGFLINIVHDTEVDWKGIKQLDMVMIQKYILEHTNEGVSNQTITFKDDAHNTIFTLNKRGKSLLINVGVDIISSAFYILFKEHKMLQEPLFTEEKHKTKCSSNSYFIINEYITFLNELIKLGSRKKGIPLLQKMPWPREKKFAACLAHDVDWFDNWKLGLYEIVKQIRKSKNLFLDGELRDAVYDFVSVIVMILKRDAVHNDIKKALMIEDNLGFRSSFYLFGNLKPKNPPLADKTYSTHGNAQFINYLLQRGREIGLHGSFWSYLSGRMLSDEKRILEEIIGREVKGLRQHSQNFDLSVTWGAQERSGFEYDVTRMDTGICFPFIVFGVSKNVGSRFIEIPLTIADEPLTGYPNTSVLSEKRIKFIEKVKTMIDEVSRFNGVVVFLWHPFEKYLGCLLAYNEVLKYLKNVEAYVTTCSDIADWWDRRASMKVIDTKYGQNCVEWRIYAGKDIEEVSLKVSNLNGDVSVIGAYNYEVDRRDGAIYVKITKLKADEEIILRCDTGVSSNE